MTVSAFGIAWIGFVAAFALHVIDEALNDFLPTYNASILHLRRRIPWAAFPTFQYRVWLGLLIAAIVLLLALSPLAFSNVHWLRQVAIAIGGVIGVLNALGHLGGSLYFRRPMPGVFSAPLLLACGVWLVVTAS